MIILKVSIFVLIVISIRSFDLGYMKELALQGMKSQSGIALGVR
jgi:hypothetical protein